MAGRATCRNERAFKRFFSDERIPSMIPFRRGGYELLGGADPVTEVTSPGTGVQLVETVQTGETDSRRAGVGVSLVKARRAASVD
jgi:hypothetical protein